MLNRYLGNKSVILGEILDLIARYAEPGDLVCDAFSGSLAVSLALKRAGYSVACNDINRFSAVYGRVFIERDFIPDVDADAIVPKAWRDRIGADVDRSFQQFEDAEDFMFLSDPTKCACARSLMVVAGYLSICRDQKIPAEFDRCDIFDHYCEAGSRSEFLSSRGRAGRRRFFSSDNARQIDIWLDHLRWWHHEGRLPEAALDALLVILLNAVSRVSNTQGTYHDFPRERMDPRALKPLAPRLPSWQGLLDRPGQHVVGDVEDSLDFIARVPNHRVLYVDPPYNFRQYTAYYFLPNLICRYPLLEDPAGYFQGVQYVRGQNMDDDFSSTFCSANAFLPSLRTLIDRSRADRVVLSYFDGKNHWNDFKSENNGKGFEKLTEFFSNGVFKRGSTEVIPVSRLNYQSYGGYKAREVAEYLFVAETI